MNKEKSESANETNQVVNNMKIFNERGTKILIPKENKISAKMSVFYNPKMTHNRDFSVAIVCLMAQSSSKKRIEGSDKDNNKKRGLRLILPMSATGVRGLRFINELRNYFDNGTIEELYINDKNERFLNVIKKELELNDFSSYLTNGKIILSNTDANKILLDGHYDYIDLDPFGSPNMFLDAAVKSISRRGILAVTATDTSDLCGTYKNPCVRKYWSKPLRNHFMKEFGLRILIRKVQLIGMQYEKALIPIFSYSKDHYFRVFFEVNKGKKRCDEVAAKHKLMVYDDRDMSIREFELNELTKNSIISNESFDKNSSTNSVSVVGPIWNGELFNLRFVEKIRDEIIERYKRDNELVNFVNLIYDEAHGIDDVKKMSEAVSRNDKEYEKDSKRNKNCFGFDSCNFYDVSIVCKRIKEVMPKPNDIIRFLGEKGKIGFRTHFNYKAIKGNFNYNNLVDAIKVLNHNKKA